jgi:hypothetical protein
MNLVQKLLARLRRKSVTTILDGFHKLSDELRALAEHKVAEAQVKEAKAQALMAEVEDAEEEAQRASHAADNIDALVVKVLPTA